MGCRIRVPPTNCEYIENKTPANIRHFTVHHLLIITSFWLLFIWFTNTRIEDEKCFWMKFYLDSYQENLKIWVWFSDKGYKHLGLVNKPDPNNNPKFIHNLPSEIYIHSYFTVNYQCGSKLHTISKFSYIKSMFSWFVKHR